MFYGKTAGAAVPAAAAVCHSLVEGLDEPDPVVERNWKKNMPPMNHANSMVVRHIL